MGNIAPFLAGALSLPLGDVGDSLADSFINSSPHYPQVKHIKSSKLLVKKKRKSITVDKSQNPHQQLSNKNLHSLNSNKISCKYSNHNLTGPQYHLVNFACLRLCFYVIIIYVCKRMNIKEVIDN